MNTYKILILEDVPFDVELMEREIKKAGINYTSKTVELEEDFTNAIYEFKPDLILADHSLPHFDGVSALDIVNKKCPEVPFIFVSGKIGEEFAVEALKRGATDYVLKSNLPKVGPAIIRAIEEVKEQKKLKKAEEDLHKKNMQLSEAQKIGHIGSWEWNFSEGIMDCSDEFYRILGVENSGKEFTHSSFLKFIDPKDQQIVLKNIKTAVENREPFYDEYKIIRPDGDIRIVAFQGKIFNKDSNDSVRIIGTIQDITQRKIAEDKLKESLEEKELLLHEIHHRVKNNLQVISSLLRLQSRHIKDPNALQIFKESQNRVSSIALVHEKLYNSKDMACVNFAEYIRDLTGDIIHFFRTDTQRIKLDLDLEDVKLNIETAIPCGLIINELITNSLKHAFNLEEEGEIYIGIHRTGENKDKIRLTVADNGRGIPPQLDINKVDSFGLQLVTNLAKRIAGEINIARNNGTRFEIIFQELNYKGRTLNGE
ncbi:histidine kinase dimerization/phosphoacceptor domain -containing protein [Methanobacterium alcaliphilum]|uniref:histidine kinase dimerization/phosphoacceptor domain -containing protein n=1 Tax=Methanobacterium alcaliphilum TaxID=392018 RepID=UPI00200A9F0F|nr:histidine kinase dimerization/phosphoacceptor domain -containing protein [Methanobacterium alcaliphilum]MCK9150958.1 response regulator [Methanobacterium alcaliphilum]